ncbi:hypothetical protein GQR58_025728 [Nymphon striatum]|nr:hypothetical protein GQR58_025728 [Nymphon striatum]
MEGDKSNMDKTDVVKAKASHGAFKGHVTRKLNSIRHTLSGISDPAFLSDKIIINVEAQLDKLEMSLSKLEYSLNILSDIIPPVDYNTLENEFDVYTSDIDNIRTAIFNLVQAYHKVHAGLEVKSPSLNDTTTPARRFLTTLKPDDLEIDTTLSDFKRWRSFLETFCYTNLDCMTFDRNITPILGSATYFLATICEASLSSYERLSSSALSPSKRKRIRSTGNSAKIKTTILPDTGANECLVADTVAKKWNIPINRSNIRRIVAANGSELRCLGSMDVRIDWYDRSIVATFFVSPDVSNTLLAWHVLIDLDMIPKEFPLSVRISGREAKTNTIRASRASMVTDHVNTLSIDVKTFQHSIVLSNKEVFDCSDKFKAMKGKPMHIYLKDVTEEEMPPTCYVARQIPLAYRDAAKAELDDMVHKEIIKPVTEPTDFVSPFLVVPKPNGKVRLVVDYKGLNKFVKRPVHPFPTIREVKMAIPPEAKWFATFDATRGYWQVPLDEDSQLLTTFLTPWGRYCYTRAPMGLSSSGDEYCLRGDRALETRYSVGELEALAMQWAILSCNLYLLGLHHFEVITDHKPLRTIANNKNLATIDNPRMQRILEKLTSYHFTVSWIQGKSHCIPDALSRSPIHDPDPDDNIICNTTQVTTDSATTKVIAATHQDSSYQDLKKALTSKSYADVKKLRIGHPIRSYLRYWNQLSISDDGLIIFDGHRIFIPAAMRSNILSILHSSHQGISRTRLRARELYFWIGMGNNIAQMIESCEQCVKFQSSQCQEPLYSASLTSRPFEAISVDLFEYASTHFMVVVDRYSGWPIVVRCNKLPNASRIIAEFKPIFRDHGIPLRMRSDGGRQFTSQQFQDFLHCYNIQHELSSAHYPQSNGHAESAVNAMKTLTKKCWKNGQLDQDAFNIALMEWRNTPRSVDGKAPSQWLFGRLQRTFAPACKSVYRKMSEKETDNAMKKRQDNQEKTEEAYNVRSRRLRLLKVGERVWIHNHVDKTWTRSGVVKQIRSSNRSYIVLSNGSSLVRNRRWLKPFRRGHVVY